MSTFELILIALALSMDAFAVSVAKGLALRRIDFSHLLSVGLWFGGFQALMPVAGYFLGSTFAAYFTNIDHWIAFVLLGSVGINMIREAWGKGDSCDSKADFSTLNMFLLAIATSIDALIVGVSFAFWEVDIFYSAAIIGVITALLSIIGLHIGHLFGCRHRSKAEFFGGVVLVLLGLKPLVEHFFL